MEKYYETNLKRWNELVAVHAKSDEYDLEGFLAGNNSLHSLELKALGDVSGKSLLHLQCHFGLDTLSWGRLGAKVTGVDFSDTAIELAGEIAGRSAFTQISSTVTSMTFQSILKESLTSYTQAMVSSAGFTTWRAGLK